MLDEQHSPDDVIKEMQNTTFDMYNGPLWKARCLNLQDPQLLNLRCNEEKKYTALLIVSMAHVIADGHTCYVLLENLVSILNSIMTRANENEFSHKIYEEFPPYISETCASKALSDEEESVGGYSNPLASLRSLSFRSSVKMRADSQWGLAPGENFNIQKKLDEPTTTRLRQLCKVHHTSMHACVTTAFRIALKNVLLPALGIHGSYIGRYMDCVDLRRYYNETEKTMIGCQLSLLFRSRQMEDFDTNNFWKTSQEEKERFHSLLKHGAPLQTATELSRLAPTFYVGKLLDMVGFNCPIMLLYGTSNMGDTTKYFLGNSCENVPVKVIDTVRCGSSHLGGPYLTLVFQTFRGVLQISCDSSTNKLDPDLSNAILNETLVVLRKVSA